MTDPINFAVKLRGDIRSLLLDAADEMATAKGNLDLFVGQYELNRGPIEYTAGRAVELAEDVLDHVWNAYELAVKAAALEGVLTLLKDAK